MARPSRQKRAARMRANVRRRAALQQQTQSPQQTENQLSTEENMQFENDEEHPPVEMSVELHETKPSKQGTQPTSDADPTEGVSVLSTQHETESANENNASQLPTQSPQSTDDGKGDTTDEVSVLGRQRETSASNNEIHQHANQHTDDPKHIKGETVPTTTNTPQPVKQEETQPTDTEETTERVSLLAKKRRKRPVPVPAPQPPIPPPQPPALTQPTNNNPPAPKASKRKAADPAETIDLSSTKQTPKRRKARVTAGVIDLCSPKPSLRDSGQRPSPKNLRKRKPVDPPATIDVRLPTKRARSSAPTSPRRTRSSTKQATHQPQQVKPKEASQKRRGARRVERADRETRKDTTVAQQDATSIKKEEPHRALRDRSQIRKPAHSQPQSQAKVKREPASQTPPPEKAAHTPLQQALLHQTQAVTNATYEVLERQLAAPQATAARRARSTSTSTNTSTNTTSTTTSTSHAHDPIPPLPLGQVLNVAKYLNTHILTRLTQTCKTVYDNLIHELHLRQHTTVIPERAWQRQIQLSRGDAEGRRTVEWHPSTGYYPGPMDLAIQHGRVDDVLTYLRKGADPNRLNSYGMRPLRWAVATGQLEMVHLLLAADADPNLPDADGSGGALAGPFVGEGSAGEPDTEPETFIETLLAGGAQIISMPAFETLCHARHAAQYLQQALRNGSTLHHLRGPSNTTVLHLAAQLGQNPLIQHLLTLTAIAGSINAVTTHGQTALHLAIRHGNEETALTLIAAGCALNVLDNFNRDAVALAVEKGYSAVVRALLDAPAAAGWISGRSGSTEAGRRGR